MTTLKLDVGALNVDDSSPLEELTLAAWRDGVRATSAEAALILPNDATPEEYSEAIGEFAVVILEFPKFADGRAYSQASALRSRFGFKGVIRARGDVLCDQVLFMARCGFDAFEIGDGDVDDFRRALQAFSAFYQASADGVAPVWRQRMADRASRRAA